LVPMVQEPGGSKHNRRSTVPRTVAGCMGGPTTKNGPSHFSAAHSAVVSWGRSPPSEERERRLTPGINQTRSEAR
ncbi:hypothetical protein, partial [Klebsiella pneumoniae]|uniref:hypothetical protein n=4 Tax=Klebsiella pneumoniae TaxID=573 RepID=UPI001B8CCDA3